MIWGEHMDFVEELAAFKMMINVLMPAVNGIWMGDWKKDWDWEIN